MCTCADTTTNNKQKQPTPDGKDVMWDRWNQREGDRVREWGKDRERET